ncbi:DNA-directed RNA polymerase II subunit GRINL1A [Elysia marginata]|uniref:DNA-directed RNA polymerase II subunit GRINL1A n=1 Tax=Elysia marginata TaxID=1093978 RepID=A0AAV4G766_9GAST|nr:DNA-directed RNA polymerase II subunit GRINL1A [Elysia marginata]
MNGPEERQGYIGDITTKSLSELKELLERKEKLLANRSLLQNLPDKGKKVYEYVEKLKGLIVNKIYEESSKMEVAATEDQQNVASITERLAEVASDQVSTRETLAGAQVIDRTDSKLSTDSSGALSDHFQNMSLGTKKEIQSDQQSTNSYEKIIQRDNDSVLHKKEIHKFVPNKIVKHKEPPNAGSEPPQSKVTKPVSEESAVYPPQYKHQKSELISLNESIQLTLEQQKKREHGPKQHYITQARKMRQRFQL